MYQYDVVVIGLGGVGSFALRALAKDFGKQGKKILGLERFHRLHEKGSSHGETRIFRRAYFEDAGYIPWIDFSIREFERLGQESGVELLNKCGNLILQDRPTEDGTKHRNNYLQLAWDAAKEHDIPVEFLENEDLRKRFPQFHYHAKGPELIGLLEPGGGFVRPELAIEEALQQAEREEGCEIWEEAKVVSLQEREQSTVSNPSVEIVVERSCNDEQMTIAANKVLIAAGAWASQLIPSWANHLTVTRQVQGWIDISGSDNPDLYQPDQLPTWILSTSNWRLPFFGIPVADADKQFTKVGIHNYSDKIEDPTHNPATITEPERAEYQHGVEVALHGTAWNNQAETLSKNIQVKTCMYTMTEDGNFLIGVPDEFNNVYAIAGLSGHGFKMTPALGQMLADFALIGEEALNAKWKPSFCHPSRFDTTKSSYKVEPTS
ncbi:Monomeric sarcosine oxidase [Seminavis robusta]|uniref:Monomeric sarcosine oxidase n=1 Tax=Seminavis robusta TaxID=568900 RepID=A0A9N8E342_9STRA|nr:Monomeric sarcosine oxidase [Seminavis robusta]|eukprot:Sro495_g154470.1 Monomeric sarcosine oxidase (435) ;mRNA; f:31441-32745